MACTRPTGRTNADGTPEDCGGDYDSNGECENCGNKKKQ